MTVQILTGDCRDILPTLPERSVQCCVTSPPYHGLRAYGGDSGMIGLEPTIDEHITALVDVFRGVWRVLKDDGTVWLNYGDAYAGSGPSGAGYQSETTKRRAGLTQDGNFRLSKRLGTGDPGYAHKKPHVIPSGLKPKDLIGLPWRIAFALQADGWYLRSAIVWHKPNPMPESVTDRPTSAYEHIFLLSKSGRYFYDAAAIAEQCDPAQTAHNVRYAKPYSAYDDRAGETGQPGNVNNVGIHARPGNPNGTRNARNVWTIATQPFSGAHFAVFPPEIPRRCILAGSREGDTVLDPFAGAGTTLLVADRLGRNAVGVEVNPEYVAMAQRRITNDAPLFVELETA